MPDRRAHRGPHPEDAELFSPDNLTRLREATSDLCWLASRGYAEVSSLKLVGDRYHLTARQRLAVARGACSDSQLHRRLAHEVGWSSTGIPNRSELGPNLPENSPAHGSLSGTEREVSAEVQPPCPLSLPSPAQSQPTGPENDWRQGAASSLEGCVLWVDGYNVLTTVEAALAGGVVLHARDGTFRDMASMHGTFRKVAETEPALEILGKTLAHLRPKQCLWYLDRPVSNSGRLKQWIEQIAQKHGWPWRVELVANPDPILWESPEIVASADSVILDHCRAWLNLARWAVQQYIPGAWIVQL